MTHHVPFFFVPCSEHEEFDGRFRRHVSTDKQHPDGVLWRSLGLLRLVSRLYRFSRYYFTYGFTVLCILLIDTENTISSPKFQDVFGHGLGGNRESPSVRNLSTVRHLLRFNHLITVFRFQEYSAEYSHIGTVRHCDLRVDERIVHDSPLGTGDDFR